MSSIYVIFQFKSVPDIQKKESDRQVKRPVQTLRFYPTRSHDITGSETKDFIIHNNRTVRYTSFSLLHFPGLSFLLENAKRAK